jgi:hypothetical protein
MDAITNGEAIYNSSLSMIIDRKEFLPNYDVRFFRRVPDQQQGINATGGATNQNAVTNGLFGFAPFEPVKIDGRQTINTTVDLGASVTITRSSISRRLCVFDCSWILGSER